MTDQIALGLRLGLGSVFIAGGWWKLSRTIDALRSEAFVGRYLASNGYINAFFEQYLFADPGALVTPLAFLTILSAFELAAGIALLAGAFVRAISLTFAFMLWTLVLALPVVTAPGVEADAPSYFSPALVAIGMLFFFGAVRHSGRRDWSGPRCGRFWATPNERDGKHGL